MEAMAEASRQPYELLLGRKTYEIFAAHWPHVSDDPIADQLNSVPKHVASTTLDRVEWNNSTLIEGDVAEQVARLKDQDGPEIQVQGSWGLIQTLLEHDFIDEFRVLAIYERAGKIEAGSFALDEPTEAEIERRRGLEES